MSLLRSIGTGLRALFRREGLERELDDEVRHYLDLATEERVRAGLPAEEAARAARLELGSTTAVKEQARSGGWEAWVESAWNDWRYAARSLRRNQGFTLVAGVTLSLGIGATTAIFSAVRAVILSPLPYRDPGRLAMLWTDDPARNIHEEETSFPTIRDWQAQSRTFAEIAVTSFDNVVTLRSEAETERGSSSFVSARLFPMLGVDAILGRTFRGEDEATRQAVAVLSYGFWQRRFGGAKDVLGKTLQLDGDGTAAKQGPRTVRIIGVMPAGFYFPSKNTQLWEPLTTYWRLDRESGDRFFNNWRAVGRLAPGASYAAAAAEMKLIGGRLSQAHPTSDQGFPGFGVTVVPLIDQITGRMLQLALWVLLGAVGLVLLIACVNVASLQLARGATRQRELAVRVALGAGRARLLRQLLTESLLLAFIGGGFGVAIAVVVVRVFAQSVPPGIARLDEIRIDDVVLWFAAAISMISGVGFGLAPAWRMSRSEPTDTLKAGAVGVAGGRALRRVRRALVVAECSLAVVLLTGAGLLLRSAFRLQAVDPGYDPSGVLLVRVAEGTPVPKPLEQRNAALAALTERLAGIPGMQRVGAISNLLLRDNPDESITLAGASGGPTRVATGQLASATVDPGFFSTMRVPLLKGRLLTRADALAKLQLLFTRQGQDYQGPAEAAVVNEAFARRFFPAEDPTRKRFYIGAPPKVYWYEVVGVVGDMHRQGLEKTSIPEYFGSSLGGTTDLVLRTTGNPLVLAASVRQQIGSIDKSLMVLSISTVDLALGQLSAQRRLQTWLLVAFALLALLLAAVGIYGLMHYTVAQRAPEIGIRVALGARPAQVRVFILREGMALAAGGIGLGVIGALSLTRIMKHLLFEVSVTDPVTFVVVPVVLGGIALAACYFPARRAARVDPLQALKSE